MKLSGTYLGIEVFHRKGRNHINVLLHKQTGQNRNRNMENCEMYYISLGIYFTDTRWVYLPISDINFIDEKCISILCHAVPIKNNNSGWLAKKQSLGVLATLHNLISSTTCNQQILR